MWSDVCSPVVKSFRGRKQAPRRCSLVWIVPKRSVVQALTIPLPRGCCSTVRNLVSMSFNRAFALPGPDFSRASICRRRSAISPDSVCRRSSTVCRSRLIWECITCTVSEYGHGRCVWRGKPDKIVRWIHRALAIAVAWRGRASFQYCLDTSLMWVSFNHRFEISCNQDGDAVPLVLARRS